MNMNIRDILQEEWSNIFVNNWKNNNKKGILNLFQRTGKIRTTLLIIEKLKLQNKKILICYPDNKIKDSWINDIKKFNINLTNVTYTNISSLKKYKDEYFDLFIWDECHSFSEKQSEIVQEIIKSGSETVIGLSGTISNTTKDELKLLYNLDIFIKYGLKNAIEDGLISDYEINIIKVPLDSSVLKKNKKGKFVSEKRQYDDYTNVIDRLRRANKSTMFLNLQRNRILQKSISKLNKLKELIKNPGRFVIFTGLTEVADSLGIPSYHSKSKDLSAINDFKDEKIDKLALAVTGGIGVTYNNLDGVILSNFTYDQEETSQILARSLMLDYHNKVAKIYIITSSEPAELKKLESTLVDFEPSKIKYVNN